MKTTITVTKRGVITLPARLRKMDLGQAQVPGTPGEFGWGGAATTFWVDPAEELIGILMGQHQPSGCFSIAADSRATVYQAIVD